MPPLAILDAKILNELQKRLPLVKAPWAKIAKKLNIKEVKLIERIKALKNKKIIRRISATFNPRKVGLRSTLVAVKVDQRNVKGIVKKINSYQEVTHNYERDDQYNIWFTLVAKDENKISQIINQIKKDKKIEGIMNLPAVKLFKIKTNFNNE